MKKYLLTSLSCISLIVSLAAQTPSEKKILVKNVSAISAGVNVPVGEFSRTHTIGFGAAYNSFKHSYNKIPLSKFSFTWNSGAAYYFGKKETSLNYTYKYPAYLFFHGNAGILYSPVKNGFTTLTAGPALGFYNSSTKFNLNLQLDINYYINKAFLLSPAVIVMKEPGATSLWSPGLKAILVL